MENEPREAWILGQEERKWTWWDQIIISMGHTFVYPVLLCNIPNQLKKQKGRHSSSTFKQRKQGFSALAALWERDAVEHYSRKADT